MTHDGPYDSATTTHLHEDGMCKFGQPSLTDLIQSNRARLLLNLHGHCHKGNTFDYEVGAPILNAGSLHEKPSFMLLELQKLESMWKIGSVTKMFL